MKIKFEERKKIGEVKWEDKNNMRSKYAKREDERREKIFSEIRGEIRIWREKNNTENGRREKIWVTRKYKERPK